MKAVILTEEDQKNKARIQVLVGQNARQEGSFPSIDISEISELKTKIVYHEDRIRANEIHFETGKALEGHRYSLGEEAHYGGGISLEVLYAAISKINRDL